MKKKRQKDNKNDKIFYQGCCLWGMLLCLCYLCSDLVKFGEVVDRPPELPGKSKGIKVSG